MPRQAQRKFLFSVSVFSTFALVAFEAQAGWCSVDQLGNQKYCYYSLSTCQTMARPMGWGCVPGSAPNNNQNQTLTDSYNAGRALGMLLFGDPAKKRQEAVEQERLELERQRLELERERLALQRERQQSYPSEQQNSLPGRDVAGFATVNWPSGTSCVYTGQLEAGVPQGNGSHTCPEGSYTGYWRYGKFSGNGVLTLADGTVITGSFVGGLTNGQGTWRTADGDSYRGSFFEGRFHGSNGVYRWADGAYYVGDFKNDQFHGQGKQYNSSGQLERSGWWCNDEPASRPCGS